METFTSIGFSTNEATMLADAHAAVTKAEMWDYLRKTTTPGGDGGFLFTKDMEVTSIIAEMTYQGHSGASQAWVLRQMEAIAKGGWTAYANRIRAVKASEQLRHEENLARIRSERACQCRAEQGYASGWCGVAGGGVPGCDH
jgi:hypothetical protein